MAAAAKLKERGAAKAAPRALDSQEERALDRAAEAVAKFGGSDPRNIAAVAISAWIVSRTSQLASPRVNVDLMFDLGDARLRGFVEAALPAIAGSLAGLDPETPLFALEKEQVLDVFMAGIRGAEEAAVAANESLGFPFDDEVPF